ASCSEPDNMRIVPRETGTATSAYLVSPRVTVPDAVAKVSAARWAIGSLATSREPVAMCESPIGFTDAFAVLVAGVRIVYTTTRASDVEDADSRKLCQSPNCVGGSSSLICGTAALSCESFE